MAGLSLRPPLRRRPVVEELEARILYAADLLPFAHALTDTADVRVVEAPTALPAAVAAEQATSPRHEIVFVDPGVADWTRLVADLQAQQDADRQLDVVLLDAGRDGVAQITEALQGRQDIAAIHLISHGEAGAVMLGSTRLDTTSVETEAARIAAWAPALQAGADILVYGCDVAASPDGQALLARLRSLSGADIAASTDLTGAARLGGDWTLEYTLGAIQARVAADVPTQADWQGVLATYTVTNTNDSGAGSFRQAIQDANANPGADTINFNIAGTGIHTITLSSMLPYLSGQVNIDATTDDSFTSLGRPAIVLDGHGSVADGLRLYSGSSGSVVRGLILQNFTDDAVDIVGSHGNTIVGNWIGLTSSGTGSAGSDTGVNLWNANNNIIGGSTAADRNVISGNALGIFIGTDNGTSSGNTITGNWVGSNAAGSAVLGSSGDGIFVRDGADNTRIGGSASGEGNWVVGAGLVAIEIDGASSGTVIQGNRIGTDAAGTANWGSQENAILIENGATGTLIGGTDAGAGNIIAFGGQGGAYTAGISVKGNATLNATILGNSIYSNVGLGIDLGGDGVTANDAGDVDSGPNNRLNTLVLTSASTDGSTLTVTGSYSGQAGTYYRVELFGNTSAEPSGTGEGRTYLGAVTLALPSGSFTGTYTLGTAVAAGTYVTATVTRTDSAYATFYETSEFSNHLQAVVPNHAPSGTDGSLTLAEDSGHTFSLADFGYSDADGDALLRVWIDTLPTSGQLLLNGSRLAAGTGVLATDIAAGGLIYQPAPDATGSASFTFRVQDDAGTANGGSDTDATPNTYAITFTAVDDAPTLGVGGSNLVANGSFESGSTGWSSNAGIELSSSPAGYGLAAAAEGSTVAEVEGQASTGVASWVQQTITTTAGQDYVFSLQAVTRNDSNSGDMGALVVDGVEIARFSTGTDWRTFAASFTATSASTTIRIVSLGSQTGATGAGDAVGLVIDDVRVVARSGSAAYTEGATPVVLAPQAVAADHDLAASGWNGASLTLARQGGADADDRFSASGTLGALVSGGSLVMDGVTIGSVTTHGGGSLVLVFDGNATSARVNAALRQIAYANASDAPPSSVTLAWTLSDGNSGAQGTGGALLASASTTVDLTATNDAPVLGGTGGSLSYAENAGAVPVAPAATVSDADSADFGGGRLVISISANGQSEDRLAIANSGLGAGQIGVSGSDVFYEGVQIGSFSGGGDGSTPLVVNLNAQASAVAVQALLRSVTYANVSDSPSSAARTISGTLEDGDGGTSTIASTTLSVAVTNDAPVITSSATFTVAENTTAVGTVTSSDADGGTPSYAITGGADAARFSIDAGTGVLRFVSAPDHEAAGDADADNVYQLTVSVDDGAGGVTSQAVSVTVANVNEAPSFVGTPSGAATAGQPYSVTISATDPDAGAVLAISASGLPGWLTLVDHGNGSATLSGTPGNGDVGGVNLMLQVSDGTLSATQALTVTVTPVNQAPVITSPAAFTIAENTTAVGTVTSSDVDGGTPSYAITGGADAARFSIDASTGALRFVTAPDHEAPLDSHRDAIYELQIGVTDGQGGTAVQSVTVTVTDVDESPVVTDLTLTGDEDTSLVASLATQVQDPEGRNARYVLVTGPAHGTVTLAADGSFQYQPAADWSGDDRFTVSVQDGPWLLPMQVRLQVRPVDDAPQLRVDTGAPLAPAAMTPIDPAAWRLVDVDTATADLTLELRAVRGGWFELAARPGVAVSSFPAEALMRGELRFQRTGLEAPSFEVRVSDGHFASSWLAVTLSAAANPEPVTPGPAPASTPDSTPVSTPVIAAPPPGAMGAPDEPVSFPTLSPATAAAPAAPAATPGAPRNADAGRVPAAEAAPAGLPGLIAADGEVPATLRPNAAPSRAADLQLPVARGGLGSDPTALPGFDAWLQALVAPAQFNGSSGWDPAGDGHADAVADLEAVDEDPLLFRADLSSLDLAALAALAAAVALLAWALRAAGVLGGLALVAPAWRMVDPLPIVGTDEPDDDIDDVTEALATEVLAGGRR